jgi:hypothetical protein
MLEYCFVSKAIDTVLIVVCRRHAAVMTYEDRPTSPPSLAVNGRDGCMDRPVFPVARGAAPVADAFSGAKFFTAGVPYQSKSGLPLRLF